MIEDKRVAMLIAYWFQLSVDLPCDAGSPKTIVEIGCFIECLDRAWVSHPSLQSKREIELFLSIYGVFFASIRDLIRIKQD